MSSFKETMKKITSNPVYVKWLKDAWPYLTGAILLSLFQIVTLAPTYNPWGVTGSYTNWGAWIFELFGGSVDKWYYFSSEGMQRTLENGFLADGGSVRNAGLILGALRRPLASHSRSRRSIEESSGRRRHAVSDGLRARIAYGCNIGAL